MNFVLIGMAYLYQGSGLPLDLLVIPLLITAIGDGLADPVGISFGKNKYQVTALFTDERYTRSIEGSMMVTLTTIFTFYFMRYLFTSGQFLFLIVTMPILMTLTEAYSPHMGQPIPLLGRILLYMAGNQLPLALSFAKLYYSMHCCKC